MGSDPCMIGENKNTSSSDKLTLELPDEFFSLFQKTAYEIMNKSQTLADAIERDSLAQCHTFLQHVVRIF